MRVKKMVCLLTALLVCACGLTACGGRDDNGGGGGDGPSSDVTLKVWVQSANQPQFFTWAAARYKELTGVTISWTVQASANLDTALAGNDSPDIACAAGGITMPKLIEGKRVLKLDDVITPAIEETLIDSAKINKNDSTDGSWYELPLYGFSSPTVFYNKTAMGELTQPQTYEEFLEIIKKVPAGKEGLVSGLGDWQMPHLMQALHARTMSVEDYNGLIGIHTDHNPFADGNDQPVAGLEKGFSLLKKYQDDGVFAKNITGYNASTASSYFTQGSAIMYAAPSLEYLTLANAPFEIGAIVLPKAPADYASADPDAPSSLVSGIYSDVFVISAKTRYEAECKAFLSWLLTSEPQEKLLEFFLFPAIRGTTTDNMRPAYKQAFESVLGDIYEELTTNGCTPFYQSYSISSMDGRVAGIAQNVLNGKQTPKSGAEELKNFYGNSGIIQK